MHSGQSRAHHFPRDDVRIDSGVGVDAITVWRNSSVSHGYVDRLKPADAIDDSDSKRGKTGEALLVSVYVISLVLSSEPSCAIARDSGIVFGSRI